MAIADYSWLLKDFCRTSEGLLKDFWRISEGLLKDFQRTYKSQPTGLRDLLDQNCTESLIKFISVVQVSLLLLLKVSTDKSSRNLTKSILNAIRGLRAQTGRKMSETSGFSFCWVKDKCVSCCWVLMMVMYEKRSIYTTVEIFCILLFSDLFLHHYQQHLFSQLVWVSQNLNNHQILFKHEERLQSVWYSFGF